MPQRATIVLGGGPSGLGAAWGLSENGAENIIVIEKAPRLGGLSGSFDWQGCKLDYGPHRFSPEFPDQIEKIRALLGDDWLEVANEHAVQFREQQYQYPPRVKDFLNWNSVSFSSQVLSSYAWHKIAHSFDHDREETFQAVITDSFGPVMFEEVVSPLCEKVWGKPDKLRPEFAKLRFSVPTFVQWGKKLMHTRSTFSDKTFFYPRFGFQQLWDALGQLLKARGVRFYLSSEALSIGHSANRIETLTLRNAPTTESFEVENLISTIPAPALARLIRTSVDADSLQADLETRGMLLVNFLIRQPQTLPKRVMIFPEKKFIFNRLSEQNLFSRDTVIAEHSVVQADIITDVGSAQWQAPNEEIIQSTLQGLQELKLIVPSQMVASDVVRIAEGYPVPSLRRENAQCRFESAIAPFSNLISTGRFASSDYNNSHTALKKGYLAGQLLVEKRKPDWTELAESLRHLPIRD